MTNPGRRRSLEPELPSLAGPLEGRRARRRPEGPPGCVKTQGFIRVLAYIYHMLSIFIFIIFDFNFFCSHGPIWANLY